MGSAVLRLLFYVIAAAKTLHKPTFDIDCNSIVEIGFFEMHAFQNAGYMVPIFANRVTYGQSAIFGAQTGI